MATTNQEREMRVAVERIVGFAKQFDEVHLNLACHAAFPLVLTPDLLYQIWAHFVPEAPWSGVARVLLSRLCRQVGYEMYEMDIAVRNLLLRELKEQFGQERLDDLADFLMDYVAQQLTEDDADTQDLREAQEWTALAYTKPDEAAQKLAIALSERVKQEDMGEVVRLASLVDTLTEPLLKAGFEPLLIYSRGIDSFVRGDIQKAVEQFGQLTKKRGKIQIGKTNLVIPSNLYIFAESPTHNLNEGLEFNRLQMLLEKGEWKEADQETNAIFLKVSNREKEGWLGVDDLRNFSCEAIINIDKFWRIYSDNRFGLITQKQIWENLISDSNKHRYEIWWNFGEMVGWRVKDKWLSYEKLNFVANAPEGHLPCFRLFIGMKMTGVIHAMHQLNRFSALMYRVSHCNLIYQPRNHNL